MRQIKWIDGELYYKDAYGEPWKSYKLHPLRRPDLPEKTASKGYATMQLLLKQGYVYANS